MAGPSSSLGPRPRARVARCLRRQRPAVRAFAFTPVLKAVGLVVTPLRRIAARVAAHCSRRKAAHGLAPRSARRIDQVSGGSTALTPAAFRRFRVRHGRDRKRRHRQRGSEVLPHSSPLSLPLRCPKHLNGQRIVVSHIVSRCRPSGASPRLPGRVERSRRDTSDSGRRRRAAAPGPAAVPSSATARAQSKRLVNTARRANHLDEAMMRSQQSNT